MFYKGKDYLKLPRSVNSFSFQAEGEPKSIPVCGFWGPFEKDPDIPADAEFSSPVWLNNEFMQKVKACGICVFLATGTYFPKDKAQINKLLNLCKDNGLRCFISSSYFTDVALNEEDLQVSAAEIKENIGEFIGHEACAGIYVRDEPFPEEIDNIAKLYKVFYGECSYKNKHLVVTMNGHTQPNRKFHYNYMMELANFFVSRKTALFCNR